MRPFRRAALLLLVAFAVAGARADARDAPAPPGRLVYATGQLIAVAPDAQTIEVRQGDRELPFIMRPDAEVLRQGKHVRAKDLHDDVGRRVRLRYTPTTVARIVDRLEVLDGANSAR
jgi:hypothetical protein